MSGLPSDILAILKLIAPKFADYSEDILLQFISFTYPQMNLEQLSDCYDLAAAYLAAHMLEVSTRDGSLAGFQSSITNGAQSISYSSIDPNESLYSTSYGIEYEKLCRLRISGVAVTGAS